MRRWLGSLTAGGPAPSAPRQPWLQALLVVLAAALSGFTLLRGIAPHDEGLMLQAGARIASGQLPYRDFWHDYPPGQALLLAGLHRAFGASLLSWRIVRVGIDAAAALLAYRLARRQAPERLALVAWAAAAGAMAFPTGPGPNPPALALALGALLAAPRRPVLTAVLVGLSLAFRLEIGLAALAGALVLVAPRRRAVTAAGALALAAAALAPFAAADPGSMWHDTVGFLGTQHLQRLPFPLAYDGPLRPSKLLEFYFPLILLVGLGLWALVSAPAGLRAHARALGTRTAGSASVTRASPEALALAPLTVVGAAYLLGRTDEFHLLPLDVVLPIALAGAAAARERALPRLALLLALVLLAAHGLERRAGQALHAPALAAVPGPAGAGVQTRPSDARALAALLAAVDRVAPRGEPIFVANPRHDLVRVGDPLLYVILNRPNPTRYDVMQPGVVTTAAVQREIVRSVQRARVRLVVRWLAPTASAAEPNGAGRSSGVHLLDRFLAARFRPLARYGDYELMAGRMSAGAGSP